MLWVKGNEGKSAVPKVGWAEEREGQERRGWDPGEARDEAKGQIRGGFLERFGTFLGEAGRAVRRGYERGWSNRGGVWGLRGGEMPVPEDELRLDKLSPMQQGAALAESGFKGAQEAVEKGVGDKKHQPERGDGNGMMMEVVIGVPIGSQFVEAFVFDPPAFVAEDDNMAGGDLVLGERGDPDPFCGLAGRPFCFKTAHDANAVRIGIPGGEMRFVPALVRGGAFAVAKGWVGGEDGPRILQQIPAFVLQNHEGVFMVAAQKFEESGLRIESVAQKDVETPGLSGDDAVNQPQRGSPLVVMGAEEFEIQQQAEAGADELEDHGSMIILDTLLSIDGKFALLAVFTAALVTAVDFVAVYHR